MCILGQKEILGADEFIFSYFEYLIFRNTHRFTEVTCISKKAKVLCIKIEEIAGMRKYEDNIQKLKMFTIDKLRLIAEQLQSLEYMQVTQHSKKQISSMTSSQSKGLENLKQYIENQNEKAFVKNLTDRGIFNPIKGHVRRSSDGKVYGQAQT